MKLALRLFAPYLAVAVGWLALESAWLTVLLYHGQMMVWLSLDRRAAEPGGPLVPREGRWVSGAWGWFVGLSVLAGPVMVLLLPLIASMDTASWLARYGLVGTAWILMIPYFGLAHPVLEQRYWAGLRQATPAVHGIFAGYHVLVLHALLPPLWLAACFGVLAGASVLWKRMPPRAALASHLAGDFSLVAAVAARLLL